MEARSNVVSLEAARHRIAAERKDIELEAKLDEADQRSFNLWQTVKGLVRSGSLEQALNFGDDTEGDDS